MIIGIGIDTVYIPRMQTWVEKPKLQARFFNKKELKEISTRYHNTEASLAARFAAKEAFGKALGTGLRGIRLSDILVQSDSKGKPELVLEGSALKALKNSGATKAHLSLSHEHNIASAIVILE